MAATITVNLGVQVSSGTQIKLPPQIKIEGVEAHKKFELTLNEGEEQEVELEEKLVFLAISSDDLTGKPVELTYTIGDSSDKIVLDAPQIFFKNGISVLKNPKKLLFQLSSKSAPSPADGSAPSTGAGNASTDKVEVKTEKVEVKVEVLAGYDLEPSSQGGQPGG